MRPQLLTVAKAAEILGVSEATLRDWRMDRKYIAFVKVGDSLRIDLREILRYIDEHTEQPVAGNVATADGGHVRGRGAKTQKVVDFPA